MSKEISFFLTNAGNEIANHGWNHPVFSEISETELHHQIHKTNAAIYNITHEYPRIMRPTYGNTNPKVNRYMKVTENLFTIIWSLDTNDWQHPGPKAITDHALSHVKGGDIILCHDIHAETIDAMSSLVDGLQNKGFKLVTVSKLLEMSGNIPKSTKNRYFLRGGFI